MNEEKINAFPEVDYVALLRIKKEDDVVGLVPNLPGKKKSLQLLHGLAEDTKNLDRNAIAEALDIYGPRLVSETQADPGKHPVIATLLNTAEGTTLSVEIVKTALPNVLERLSETSADKPLEYRELGRVLLETGDIRTAEKVNGVWSPQLYGIDLMNACFGFPMQRMGTHHYDKVPLLTDGWTDEKFQEAGIRFIPGSFARAGAYIGKGTTLMPGSIVNTGAYVAGEATMIDGGARVATGAQLGKRVKLGAGSGLEGILEPRGMLPTILEDDVRVGANCEIKGLVDKGSVVASGVVMASGVKIYDERVNDFLPSIAVQVGDVLMEMPYIPPNRVAVPGMYLKENGVGGTCVRLLEKSASETSFGKAPKHAQLYVTV